MQCLIYGFGWLGVWLLLMVCSMESLCGFRQCCIILKYLLQLWVLMCLNMLIEKMVLNGLFSLWQFCKWIFIGSLWYRLCVKVVCLCEMVILIFFMLYCLVVNLRVLFQLQLMFSMCMLVCRWSLWYIRFSFVFCVVLRFCVLVQQLQL